MDVDGELVAVFDERDTLIRWNYVQGLGSALAAALAEEGSCFAGLDPKHRVPKLKNETRLELARKLALRQHDKSPIVLDGFDIVDRGCSYQSGTAVAALRGKHMSKHGRHS